MRRSLTGWLVRLVDALLSPLLLVSLLVARLYRRLGTSRTPTARALYDRVGVYPVLDHYYEPLAFPDPAVVQSLSTPRDLPGVELHGEEQLRLLARLRFQDELRGIPLDAPGDGGPFYRNGFFESGDAEILYSLLRLSKPRRVVEVGSGYSTLFARHAIEANAREDPTYACEHVCIEPYRAPWLEHTGAEVMRTPIEECDLAVFDKLGENDVLFIDSSHVVRPRGDVLRLYLEIIPRLAEGCLIHVHDVFTPRDYPARWVRDERRLWNEQYLVEALLSGGSRLEVVLALNFLQHTSPAALHAACPMLAQEPGREPGSLWLRVREPASD